MEIFQKGKCAGTVLQQAQKNGIYASISIYENGFFNNSWHYHTNTRMSFVLHGGCAEKKQRSYERLPGSVTFYMPGEPHRIEQIRDSMHVNLEMDAVFLKQYGISEKVVGQAINQTPDAQFMLLKLYKEMMQQDAFTASSIEMLLLEFLHVSASGKKDYQRPRWVAVVHQLMHDRWNENLSLQVLSDETGIHPVTISYYFPKYFACTFGAYMRKLKVSHALTLMKAGNTSLTSIAYECGFADQSHFIHTFKNLTGFLPAKYRKLYSPRQRQ